MIKQNTVSKLISAMSLICISMSAMAQIKWVDQTEVIVNDEVILKSDVEVALKEKVAQVLAQNQNNFLSDIDALRKTVVEELIERSILSQRAKRIGVSVSDQMLNDEISGIAARNNMGLAQFVAVIEQQGQDYSRYRENVREQIMIQMLVRYEVGNRIRVSEAQTDRLLTAEQSKQVTDPEYQLLHKRFDTKESAQTYYDALSAEALKADSSASDLGYRKAANLPQIFVANLGLLDDRQVSKVLERSGSFHIIQVIDIKGDAKQSITQHFARHILIMPNELRSKDEALVLANELHQRAVAGEDLGVLAKEFSEDAGSAALNGELGWTDGSEMVAEFRDALPLGEINEISNVFETQYGYHFLQVTKRRQKDLYDKNLRDLAKQEIGDKAFKEEYPRWLADLKLSAYIKYSNESDVEFQLNRIKDDQVK